MNAYHLICLAMFGAILIFDWVILRRKNREIIRLSNALMNKDEALDLALAGLEWAREKLAETDRKRQEDAEIRALLGEIEGSHG